MASSDAVEAKTQLRLTTQRLSQLQEKKYSQKQITRSDIATLLRQGNIALARAKAQNIIHEDNSSSLLEILELHVRLILQHFDEIVQSAAPTPVVVEAASSIIFASSHTDSRDLKIVRDILIKLLGPDFARSAIGNYDNHVPSRVIQMLSAPPPSANDLDDYLINVAAAYGVQWRPEPRRQDILNNLSELLDPQVSIVIDLPQLRKLCSQGIPDDPPWLRPRIWKILFGVLPAAKASWAREIQSQRESYYHLVRRILEPFSAMLPPTTPLDPVDVSLLNVFKQLSRIPPTLFSGLEDEPEFSDMSPLDSAAPDNIVIDCAHALDSRLRHIQEENARGQTSDLTLPTSTPEIRLELDQDETGSPTSNESSPSRQRVTPTTLLSPNILSLECVHQKHLSALLRLLYLHSCINPANRSPHIPSLLVPLYSVLIREIEPQDLAHVEADTFWLFEAIIGEFSELEDEEGGSLWMKKFSERLTWADEELAANLHAKGLDPALPHYSYHWLAPILTRTLPLSSVILVWDALFSRPKSNREKNPKLDYLLDICTSMLIRARTALFRVGKPGVRAHGLWDEETDRIPPPSPLRAWELGDAFLEGMSLLQHYPVEAAGGIDRLLQMASDLSHQREEEAKTQKDENLSFGERLKVSMWKGFASQAATPEQSSGEDDDSSDEQHVDDGNETETQAAKVSGITSRLATTVWRGITNQTSMDPPPSPMTPSSPSPSPSPSPSTSPSIMSPSESNSQSSPVLQGQGRPSIWSYAEKLKESDTVANLAKVSSNWRAKAMMGTWSISGGSTNASPDSVQISPTEPTWPPQGSSVGPKEERRPTSLPDINRTNSYSPPPRPAFFRAPRDSWLPQQPTEPIPVPNSPKTSPQSDSGLLSKTQNIRASLASLTRSVSPLPAAKSAPRPLLLNSSSLITTSLSSNRQPPNGNGSDREWSDVLRGKGASTQRDSQSSISSLAPSDALTRSSKAGNRSDWDSDTGGPSRVIPLNRRSVSPMATASRVSGRPTSASSGTSSDRGLLSPTSSTRLSPHSTVSYSSTSRVTNVGNPPAMDNEGQGRMTAVVEEVPALEPPRKLIRKKTPPPTQSETDDTSDASLAQVISKSPRRTKRYPPNLNIRIRDNSSSRAIAEQKTPSPNSLAPPEGPDDHDPAKTPMAPNFDDSSNSTSSRRMAKPSGEGEGKPRKTVADGHEGRVRYTLVDGPPRTRTVSGEGKEAARRIRESAAIDGDDEGYDDLLSAYESEDGSKMSAMQASIAIAF